MNLLEFLFGRRPKVRTEAEQTFKMLNGYTPRFTTWRGSIYEAQLVRAAIHTRASHISKLKIEIPGTARDVLRNKLKHGPNQLQTWSQFMYRLSTILDTYNTAFIVPVFDEYGAVSGVYTPLPKKCEIVQVKIKDRDVLFLRYEFGWGQHASIELEDCGILTKHQLHSDFFGETNEALKPTMELIHIQNQGIEEGVKTSARYAFMAKVNNFSKVEDLKAERKRFSDENFKAEEENGGILLFPNTYADIKQIDTHPWVVDANQMKLINESVYEYFGVNEAILQNRASADEMDSFFNGAIEPFMIQLSEVMTKMLFTFREQSAGNKVIINANRLQYMSVSQKVAMAQQLGDRGALMIDEIRDLFNLPPLPDGNGQHAPIRGEYYYAGEDLDDAEREKLTEVNDDESES